MFWAQNVNTRQTLGCFCHKTLGVLAADIPRILALEENESSSDGVGAGNVPGEASTKWRAGGTWSKQQSQQCCSERLDTIGSKLMCFEIKLLRRRALDA